MPHRKSINQGSAVHRLQNKTPTNKCPCPSKSITKETPAQPLPGYHTKDQRPKITVKPPIHLNRLRNQNRQSTMHRRQRPFRRIATSEADRDRNTVYSWHTLDRPSGHKYPINGQSGVSAQCCRRTSTPARGRSRRLAVESTSGRE
jgi:hypothetical protein